MKKVNKTFLVTYTGTTETRFQGFRETIEAKSEREAVERIFHKLNDTNYWPDGNGYIYDCDRNVLAGPGDRSIEWGNGSFVAELISED
jgi:hypothetical protein